eukprot:Ihof_evm14s139 gene=Ihof_evmTU14s139
MHPTPDLTGIDYDSVYEPAEDTFLFLDALEKDLAFLKALEPKVCLEVGSGSGCVITFLGTLLGNTQWLLSTDVNHLAAKTTLATSRRNHVNSVEPIICDLLSGLVPRLNGLVDVLLFNPPYVVTPSEEVGTKDIAASWAGGVDGREVTDRLLPLIPNILSQNGCFYIVVLPENKPEQMIEWFGERGFVSQTIASTKS